MFGLKLIATIFLISFTTRSNSCDDCNEETKKSFSIMFCDEATHCSNETAEEFLDKFRHCIAKSSEEAKHMIDSGNKLEPEECIKEVSIGACNILKDMKDNTEKYGECMAMFHDMESALNSCSQTDNDVSAGLESMAIIVCADPSKIKCECNDAMDAFNVAKNCLNDNVDGMKQVKSNGNMNECKIDAKEKIVKAVQDGKSNGFITCMDAKKEFLDKNNPNEKCTGFE